MLMCVHCKAKDSNMSDNNIGRKIGSSTSSVLSLLVAKAKQGYVEAQVFAKDVAQGAKEGWNPTLEAKKVEPKVEETEAHECVVEVPKVGSVKYSPKDLELIFAKMARREHLTRFDQLVLKAEISKGPA